jgi:hypothetical protein
MEFVLCLALILSIFVGLPTGHLKTVSSISWLLISLLNFVVEPSKMSVFATYAKYAFLAFIGIIFTYLIAVPLTPLIVLFANKDDGYLPRWLCWFQTFDAPVDQGWIGNYFTNATPNNWWERVWSYSGQGTPSGFNRWLLRIRWLWRNPAYGFDLWPLGMNYDPSDWVITILEVTNGQLMRFAAQTKDGKHFSYCDHTNRKFGWKLWWALDTTKWTLQSIEEFTHVAVPSYYDRSKRIMFVFTP